MLNAPVHRMSKTPKVVSIYAIASPSGKVYVGQSWDTYGRYILYRRHGCVKQPKLLASLKKYGFDSHQFSILQELPHDAPQSVLDAFEQVYMDLFSSGVELLNIRQAGSRGVHSDATKLKISASAKGVLKRKGPPPPKKGRAISAETRAKISAALRGRSLSEEARRNISASQIGKKMSAAAIRKMMKPISQFTVSGEWVKDWDGQAQAARHLNLLPQNIYRVLSGDRTHVHGFVFKYKSNPKKNGLL